MKRQYQIDFIDEFNGTESHKYKSDKTSINHIKKAVEMNFYDLKLVRVRKLNEYTNEYIPVEIYKVKENKVMTILNRQKWLDVSILWELIIQ